MLQNPPTEITFTFDPSAKLYMPGQRLPTHFKGFGYITLSFEPTEDESVLAVGVRHVKLEILPLSLAFDVNRDGVLEYIELDNTKVDEGIFDLDRSRGSLDLATGDFKTGFDVSNHEKRTSFA